MKKYLINLKLKILDIIRPFIGPSKKYESFMSLFNTYSNNPYEDMNFYFTYYYLEKIYPSASIMYHSHDGFGCHAITMSINSLNLYIAPTFITVMSIKSGSQIIDYPGLYSMPCNKILDIIENYVNLYSESKKE